MHAPGGCGACGVARGCARRTTAWRSSTWPLTIVFALTECATGGGERAGDCGPGACAAHPSVSAQPAKGASLPLAAATATTQTQDKSTPANALQGHRFFYIHAKQMGINNNGLSEDNVVVILPLDFDEFLMSKTELTYLWNQGRNMEEFWPIGAHFIIQIVVFAQ